MFGSAYLKSRITGGYRKRRRQNTEGFRGRLQRKVVYNGEDDDEVTKTIKTVSTATGQANEQNHVEELIHAEMAKEELFNDKTKHAYEMLKA